MSVEIASLREHFFTVEAWVLAELRLHFVFVSKPVQQSVFFWNEKKSNDITISIFFLRIIQS
jgi:hypothetical protein